MKRGKPKKKSNLIINLLIVVCVGVLVYSLWGILRIQLAYKSATDEYAKYQDQIVLEQWPNEPGQTLDANTLQDLRGKIDRLAQENADFVAWIVIPGTNISYPVVQGSDNDYYLTHTFAGAQNSSGAIFMDWQNTPDFEDDNTIIYGHNMHNGTMFENLNQLLNTTTLAEHHEVYVLTREEMRVYSIFSARKTDIEDIGYVLFPSDPGAYFSTLPGGASLSAGDKVLTLSTCTYQAQSDERVVVQASLSFTMQFP